LKRGEINYLAHPCFKPREDAFYDLVIGVAEGRVSKAAITVFLEKHSRSA